MVKAGLNFGPLCVWKMSKLRLDQSRRVPLPLPYIKSGQEGKTTAFPYWCNLTMSGTVALFKVALKSFEHG
jgi:hypothetical protein